MEFFSCKLQQVTVNSNNLRTQALPIYNKHAPSLSILRRSPHAFHIPSPFLSTAPSFLTIHPGHAPFPNLRRSFHIDLSLTNLFVFSSASLSFSLTREIPPQDPWRKMV